MPLLPRRRAVAVFLAFAFAYFFSALVRAITATLSPTLVDEFSLSARDLGLLAGGYFLGFSLTQLPLGTWLDRHGPRRVILGFLVVAVIGCGAFAAAGSFAGLLLARVLTGVGVSACLMAPLTGYRRWLTPDAQLRANSWMLMTGSLGMLASTLPVQWLLPVTGWRVLFLGLAVLLVVAMLTIAWLVPRWETPAAAAGGPAPGYGAIWRHPYFRRLVPLGFFSYGGLVAMQTLWAGPWLVKVAGFSPAQAAGGLFWINLSMLFTFWGWGFATPWLARRGIGVDRLIGRGLPLSLLLLAIIIIAGPLATTWAWALFCISCTFVSLAQPAVAMAFPAALAGRALSAYNLVIFVGVFVVQWGIGLMVDGLRSLGLAELAAYRGAMAAFLACCTASWLYFVLAGRHNAAQQAAVAGTP
ncbi:MAG: MFS transporter [Ramlibacter sp.]|nr:MFS transporter [Ramlibacter sp.]